MAKRDNWWRNWIGRLELATGRNFSGKRHAWLVDVIIEAGRQPDPALMGGLVLALALADRKLAWAAAGQIELLFESAPATELLALVEAARHLPVLEAHEAMPWDKHHNALQRRVGVVSAPRGVHLAAAAHADGHLREAALKHLDPRASRAARAMILIRLADWVPVVQRQAESLLRQLLSHNAQLAPDFLDLLPLARWAAHRSSCPELMELLERLSLELSTEQLIGLVEPGSPTAAADGALDLALFALDAAASRPDHERRDLHLACTHSSRLRIALAGARAALAEDRRAGDDQHARALLRSKRPELRILGLRALADTAEPKLLRQALFDPATRVAELAAHLTTTRAIFSNDELIDLYTGPAADPEARLRKRVAAVLGLGRTSHVEHPGAARTLELLENLARDPTRPRLAAAATTSIARLARDKHHALFIELFPSPSAAVSRAALRALLALSPYRPVVTSEQLIEWTRPELPAHVRGGALRLVHDLSKWSSLEVVLAYLGHKPSEGARVEADARPVRALEKWLADFNRRFTRPTATELETARHHLRAARPRLPERLARELDSILRPT
jgi:hypothetical protein